MYPILSNAYPAFSPLPPISQNIPCTSICKDKNIKDNIKCLLECKNKNKDASCGLITIGK